MRFDVAIDPASLVALDALAAEHRATAREWWEPCLAAARATTPATERRRALAELRRERDRLRAAGDVLDTRSALVAHLVRADLHRRGWDARTWRPVPDHEASLPGRRWGTPHQRTLTSSLAVVLPDDLGETLRRAAWWSSATATRRLQDLADHSGRVPLHGRRELNHLRTQIHTPASLIRDAVHASLHTHATRP